MGNIQSALKRVVVGRPMSHGELEHTLLPKTIALPIFSSDALSSVAYATQEIVLVLAMAGAAALQNVVPISIAVATLLVLVVLSYRQTVRAYPSGGGAYIVAHENLGVFPGLLAAGALLIDYVLTVSVSVTAGVEAIVSAAESVEGIKVELAIVAIVLVCLANLRGVRESGIFFAIPTYGFVLSVYLLIGTGLAKCVGGCPQAESATEVLEGGSLLTTFLVLRAFSAGTTALTGVEAISNGVSAFRYPQSRNAALTLSIMGAVSISMFLGISWLAAHTHVRYQHGDTMSVVAQIAHAIFGGGPMFYVVQVMTAAILFLAANTAFAGFPRLSSILARDHFMPRQLMNLGDRLVFSNGIIILSLLASLLIAVFDADLNRLIQLYLVGVFISFTLSQAGMVVHWRRFRERGWRRSLGINAVGASVTAIVLIVVIATKFLEGAWIVVSAIPVIIFAMYSIHSHYAAVARQLEAPERLPVDRRAGQQHMVILVSNVDAAAARAVGYVRAVRPSQVTAVTTERSFGPAWSRLAPDIPLDVLPPGRSRTHAVRTYLKRQRTGLASHTFLTLVVPEVLKRKGLLEILLHPRLHRLKAAFLSLRDVQVLDVPMARDDIEPGADFAHEPARNFAVVLVSGVHNAALQAIEYAETLRPTSLRAVSFGLDPETTEKLGNAWMQANVPHPLEIEDAPFRDIGTSLREYVKQFNADGADRVVTVVIPEFIVRKRRHRLLHGQSALIVKRHLLFERGVVVASVPYHLE
jgi:amino acid transporter